MTALLTISGFIGLDLPLLGLYNFCVIGESF